MDGINDPYEMDALFIYPRKKNTTDFLSYVNIQKNYFFAYYNLFGISRSLVI